MKEIKIHDKGNTIPDAKLLAKAEDVELYFKDSQLLQVIFYQVGDYPDTGLFDEDEVVNPGLYELMTSGALMDEVFEQTFGAGGDS